ncbi:hypothetical protein A2U01_0059205, partial [Trifolium medium]|nr:hypothetical protein [Trifolium medium]
CGRHHPVVPAANFGVSA